MPNVGGVQSWSVGPLYPYTVVLRGGATRGVCYVQGPSGKGEEHAHNDAPLPYEEMNARTFKQAHQAAELDAKYMLAADQLVVLAAAAPVPAMATGVGFFSDVEPTDVDLQAISDGDLLDELTVGFLYELDETEEEVVELHPEDFVSGSDFLELIQ